MKNSIKKNKLKGKIVVQNLNKQSTGTTKDYTKPKIASNESIDTIKSKRRTK